MITKLIAAIFYVKDIDKSKQFYVDILECKIVADQGEYVTLYFGDNKNNLLALNSQHRTFQKVGKQTISVKSNDIERDYKILVDKGIKIFDKLSNQPWGKYFAFLDLDGNHIDVTEQ